MLKRFFYKIYKKVEKIPLFVTCIHFIYSQLIPIITKNYKPVKYNSKNINFKERKYKKYEDLKNIKIAIIADDMTYENYKTLCDVFFLTPDNWLEIMTKYEPDVFFCESAWSGIKEYKDAWRGKIYKNQNIKYENRRVLFDILDFCKKSNIKTIFWNKEDPIYFNDKFHNFSDTALKFDYIFTTAFECVEKYKKMGHKNVFVSSFGFSPELFNFDSKIKKQEKAVFVGSWYSDHLNRCKDMEKIFDMLLEKKITLEIYDRHYASSNPINQFPERYKPYIHKAVSYKELSSILNGSRFAVNINTEKNSKTMFARRVFELMACKCIVISNDSIGMREMFGNNVWFEGEDFNINDAEKICEENYKFVMEHCTNTIKLKEILKIADILK